MKFKILTSKFLLLSVLAFAACDESSAQVDAENTTALGVPEYVQEQQKLCTKLSKESGFKYRAVSGKALRVSVSSHPADCLPNECKDRGGYMGARLQSLGDGTTDYDQIIVVTPWQRSGTLNKDSLYMTKGEAYIFCGKEPEENKIYNNKKRYEIDDVSTIKKIEVGEK